MFCPKCGNQISENDRYCYRCGYVINGNRQQAGEPEYSYSGEYGAVRMRKGRTRKKNTPVSAVGLVMVIFALIVCAAAVAVVINPDLIYIGRPQYAALKVCRAIKNSDAKAITKAFTGEDADENRFEDLSYSDRQLLDLFLDKAVEIDYEVVGSSKTCNTAVVSVKIYYSDYSRAFIEEATKQTYELFSAALAGVDIDNYINSDAFFKYIIESVRSSSNFVRANEIVKFSCERDGLSWKIADMPDAETDKLLNIISLGIVDAAKTFSADYDEGSVNDADDDYITYDNCIDVPPNHSIELQKINVRVKSSEEKKYIRSDNEFLDDISAPIGTKFIIVKGQVENITKDTIDLYADDFMLFDSLERQYYPMDDSLYYFDDAHIIFELAPNIKTDFTLVYNVPDNSTDCFIAMGKGGTSDLYCFYID